MTNGIGNPDWQRRYTVSAVPIFSSFFSDMGTHVSGVNDSNGYQYLLVSTNADTSTAYTHVIINWYQDAAGTQNMGGTDWVTPPGVFIAQKVPVATRYYTVELSNISGGSNTFIAAVIYGTNADQENLLTQNTAQPLFFSGVAIAAGVTTTFPISGIFGGQVMLMIDDTANNKWSAKLQFYDWGSAAYHSIWAGYGSDLGQAMSMMVNMPYAPMQLLVTNLDTVANTFFMSVVAP